MEAVQWDVLDEPRPTLVLVTQDGSKTAEAARATFLSLWEAKWGFVRVCVFSWLGEPVSAHSGHPPTRTANLEKACDGA